MNSPWEFVSAATLTEDVPESENVKLENSTGLEVSLAGLVKE